MDQALTDILVEYELAARAALPQAAFDYIAAGAGDELTLEESRSRLAPVPASSTHLATDGHPGHGDRRPRDAPRDAPHRCAHGVPHSGRTRTARSRRRVG